MLEYAVVPRSLLTGMPPAAISPRRRSPRREMYAEAGVEPRLEELLSDPLTEVLMQRDGVSPASLRQLILDARKVLLERATAH